MQLKPITIGSQYYPLIQQLSNVEQAHLINNVQNCFLRFQNKKPPDILLVTDVDHSIIPWEKEKYKKSVDLLALKNNQSVLRDIQERSITALVTGLGWRSMKEINSYFEGFPVIDFLSCDNGKGDFFFNQNEHLPHEWIKQLKLEDSNFGWQSYMKDKVGWDKVLVMSTFHEALQESGFNDTKQILPMTYPFYIIKQANIQNTNVSLVIDPDESSFYLKKEPGILPKFYEDLSKDLSELIKDKLKKTGASINYTVSDHDNYFYSFFYPNNGTEINKASIMDYLFEICPDEITKDIKAIIAIGDSGNDRHLVPHAIRVSNNKTIPVYSIFSGTGLVNKPPFSNHPRIEIAQNTGDVGNAIRNVVSKIDQINQSDLQLNRIVAQNVVSAKSSNTQETLKGHGFSMPLSENIHLVGDLLGKVILEQAGDAAFNNVEKLRGISKELRNDPSLDRTKEIAEIVEKMDLDTSMKVLRAFTIYFHLVNESEKNEIIRINRTRELNASHDVPRKESIAEAVYSLQKRGTTKEELQALLNKLNIQPVFTAHPTEAKRPELISALNTISELLYKRDMEKLTPNEHRDVETEIKRQIMLLWLTPEIRPTPPTVLEEAENTIYFLSNTVFPVIPTLHDDLKNALKNYYPKDEFTIPAFLQFGSWVGGDRDGHPNVTPEITKEVLLLQADEILKKYVKIIEDLSHEFSLSINASQALVQSIQSDQSIIATDSRLNKLHENEPYRIKFWFIEKKLENTLNALNNKINVPIGARYTDSKQFLHDLNLIKDSLKENNASIITESGPLADLIIQVEACGFHLAELDIRQHCDEHEKAVTEILSVGQIMPKLYKDLSENERIELLTRLLKEPEKLVIEKDKLSSETQKTLEVFNTIRFAHENFGKESVRCYIGSFTQKASDLLEIMLLAKEADLIKIKNTNNKLEVQSEIDIVPLSETDEDLSHPETLLNSLFNNEIYKTHIDSRNKFHEHMLGYSDSNKDSGCLSANVKLYNAKKNIPDACSAYNIAWRLFHGRGGSIGRGGGQAGRAIQADPYKSVGGKIRFTEQGEVLSFRYSLLPLAHRHLESIIHSVLLASSKQEVQTSSFEPEWLDLMNKLADSSKIKYRELVYDDPEFWNFYIQATPIKFISQLKIASRPASRTGLKKIEDLRAIPWGFSWTQTRMMIPSWYGVGTALNEAAKLEGGKECLQNMYKNWPFFKSVIDNCQTALAKADMHTASQYITLVEPKELGERVFSKIKNEYDLTRQMLLLITGYNEVLDNTPVIQKSIKLRNPYTDPLNYIQVELLRRLKNTSDEKQKEQIVSAILLSINGVAAAMQETG